MSYGQQNCIPYVYDEMCTTNIMEGVKYTFVWKISEFSRRPEENGDVLISKEFIIKGPHDKVTKWSVDLYPRGKKKLHKQYISIYLNSKNNEDVEVRYVVSTLDAHKVKHKIIWSVTTFEGFDDGRKDGWGLDKAIPRRKIAEHTPGDILTLFVEVTVKGEDRMSTEVWEELNGATAPICHYEQLVHDFESAIFSNAYSDVTVKCCGKVFNCHKIILTSRSLVFQKMFESNMKENESGVIEINDMKLEVFEDLLKYIYTGKAPNVDSHVEELFAASDQYQVEKLKQLCEDKLCFSLDIANCVQLLVLGDMHHAPYLKASALKFVSKNIRTLELSWKRHLQSYPNLMFEVMTMTEDVPEN